MNTAAVKPVNPFVISAVVSMATFMEVLDTTIANVALTSIAGALSAGTAESTWVLTSYLVANGIVLPLSGWLSGLMGRKNFFILCIVGFTTASFLCGIAASLPMLIVCRLLQGLAGGGLQPAQQAIIKDAFPPEKLGLAFAITGVTIVLAPILGPVLGGYITDHYSWRWIFFMNVPVGIIVAVLVKMVVQDPPGQQREKGSIDYIGLGLVALGLGALQIVLDKGQQDDWFDSSFIVVLSCIAAVSLIAAVVWLLEQKNPVIKLRLLAIPSFGMANVMMFFVGFVLYSSTMLLPMMVQMNFGYSATLAGLVLSPGGLVSFLLLPVIAALVGRVQAKYLISFGMLMIAAGMWVARWITPQTDYHTLVLIRIVQTCGLPFLFVPASTLAFSKVATADSSNASAIFSLMRNLGGCVGISVATSILSRGQQIQQANLVRSLTELEVGYRDALAAAVRTITDLGVPAATAHGLAQAKIYQELIRQASILAFRDVYQFLAVVAAALAALALYMPGNTVRKKDAPKA